MKRQFLKSHLLMLLGLASVAQAQDSVLDLGEMPYKHAQNCQWQLDRTGFDIFDNKNCSVLFIAPPAVEKPQHRVTLEGTVPLCEGNNLLRESLNMLAKQKSIIEIKKAKALENDELDKLAKLSKISEEIAAQLEESQKSYGKFSSIHASTVQSVYNNSIDGTTIDAFLDQNKYLFFNNPGAKPYVTTLVPEKSIYSFVHYRPEGASEEIRSILSTTIPGLEELVQPTAQQTNVAHVKAGDVVSGETRFTLVSTCEMVEKVNDKWILKENPMNSVMTVNRKYEVPMKVGYGINARLDSNVAAGVMANLIANSTNHGFSKAQFYEKILKVAGTEVFKVVIDTDVPMSDDQRSALEHDIRQRLVDRFLAHFELRGDLVDLRPVEVKLPEGGMAPVNYVGTHCWSSSGWFSSSGGCSDYVYTVNEWHNGKTSAEIKDYLSVDLDISEVKIINDVVYIPFTTTFPDDENKAEKSKDEGAQ